MASPSWLSMSLSSAWLSTLLLLLMLAINTSRAAAQLNTDPWPTAGTGYTDVSEKYVPILTPYTNCNDVIGRFSFTHPGQVFRAPFAPFNATGRSYCRKPWQDVGLVAEFQTSDFVPFDGIVGVWMGGVEIMRGLFPEGTTTRYNDPSGTKQWSIWKSVTPFLSRIGRKQTVKVCVVYANSGNSYTPVLNATFTLLYHSTSVDAVPARYAPIVRPITRGVAKEASWFKLSQGGTGRTTLMLPRNMVSASIEVIGTNAPQPPNNDQLNGVVYGSIILGRDKQVQVLVDNVTVGFACVNFIEEGHLHEPLPLSYSVDITPLIGRLVDGRPHSFAFRNPNKKRLLLAGNLFIDIDPRANTTSGTLLESSASGPFEFITTRPSCPSSKYCSNMTANSSVALRGSVKSSAGLEYINVTQVASLVQHDVTDFSYSCEYSDLNLSVVQQTSRSGNHQTPASVDVHLENVFAVKYSSCADAYSGCYYNGATDKWYSLRRTQQGALTLLQYHRTHSADRGDAGFGPGPEYDEVCYYTRVRNSEFVFADYPGIRCFTLNNTDTLSQDETGLSDEDSHTYASRLCAPAV